VTGCPIAVPTVDQCPVMHEGASRVSAPSSSGNYHADFYVRIAGCVARYGTVVDSRTRRPVSGATVSVGGRTATTDQNGWFRLDLGCAAESCIGFNTTILSSSHPNYESGSFVAGRGVCFVQRVDYDLVRRWSS
jgi:hypothetical protein